MLYFYFRISFDVLKVQYWDEEFAYIRIGLNLFDIILKISADNHIRFLCSS